MILTTILRDSCKNFMWSYKILAWSQLNLTWSIHKSYIIHTQILH